MKNIKKVSVLLITIMISILLTSCEITLPKIQKNYTPEESMQVYVDLSAMRENSYMADFIGSEEEKRVLFVSEKIKLKNKVIEEINEKEIQLTDNQIERIYEAALKAVDKINFQIEKVSEENDKAEVKVICNYLDFTNMVDKLKQYVQEESKGAVLRDEDDIIDLTVNALVRCYEECNVSSDTHEAIFKMHREGPKWVLDDEEAFDTEMGKICIIIGL